MNYLKSFIITMLLISGYQPAAMAFHTDTHFEDTVKHKVVYQLNKADPAYIDAVLFSVGELLRKFGDDIHIVVTTIGPGLHLIGKRPGRPISPLQQERVRSLASYGIEFQACGNTMKTLNWRVEDLFDDAVVVPIGAESLMLLQQQGYSYISW